MRVEEMSRRMFTTFPSTWSTSTTVVSPSLRTTRAPRIVAGKRRAQLSGSRYSAWTRSAGAFMCSLTTASIMVDLTTWPTGPRRRAPRRIAGASQIQRFDRHLVGATIIFPRCYPMELRCHPFQLQLCPAPPPAFGHHHMVRKVLPEVAKWESTEYEVAETSGRKSLPKLPARVTCRLPPPFDEDLCNPVLPRDYHQKSSVRGESNTQSRQRL